MRRLLLFPLLLALVCCAGSHAYAAGPLDGSYILEGVIYPTYVVVLQSGDQVGMAILDTYFSGWAYGFGTLNGGRVAGDVFLPDNSVVGSFDVTFGPEGVFSGTLVAPGYGATINVTGKRFF